jgi:uncharacterized membrane protein
MQIPLAIAVAIPYLALEMAWLGITVPRIYAPLFARVQGTAAWEKRPAVELLAAAVVAYVVLIAGIVYFALNGDPSRMSYRTAAMRGAFLGLVVYGTYNLTNYVAFAQWGLTTLLVDTTWGTCVVATVSVLAKLLHGL